MFKNVPSWNVGPQWNMQVVLYLHSHLNQLHAHLRAPCRSPSTRTVSSKSDSSRSPNIGGIGASIPYSQWHGITA